MQEEYDVVIIGGGVTGTAILFTLSHYTNIKRIALIEKYSKLAQVNSANWNNSQTLHFGDIETNYTYEKAKCVKEGADMVKKYLAVHDPHTKMHNKTKKMVLAVGDNQVQELEKRYTEFKTLFPGFKRLYKEDIEKLEPNITKNRNPAEKIMALCSDDGYAVDFGKLSESFVEQAKKSGKEIEFYFGNEVSKITEEKNSYTIKTDKVTIKGKMVMVAAGSHSLIFAQQLGYAKDTILLPVVGSFYAGRNLLSNKVYTMQEKKLPFAAIHGDPDVNDASITRFGPTAKVLPLLERGKPKSIIDFFKMFQFRIDAILSLFKIIADPILFQYIFRNFMYDVPIIGKYLFLKEVRKIIPSARLKDIHFAQGYGGIRPQVVDVKEKKMDFGTAEIVGNNILFNITPSPGASTCLKNSENDAKQIVKMLGKKYIFDVKKFQFDFSFK